MKTYKDYLKAYECAEVERKHIKSNLCKITGLGVNMDVSLFAIQSAFKFTRYMTDALTKFLSFVALSLTDSVVVEPSVEYEFVIKSEDSQPSTEIPNALDPETSRFYTLAERETAAGDLLTEIETMPDNRIQCAGYQLVVSWKQGKAAVSTFGELYMLGASGVYQHIREVPNQLLAWLGQFKTEGQLLDAIYSYENSRKPRAVFA